MIKCRNCQENNINKLQILKEFNLERGDDVFCIKCLSCGCKYTITLNEIDEQTHNERQTENTYIENAFRLHKVSDEQKSKQASIREKAKELAYLINNLTPESRERNLANTKLEEVVMWANAAISRN